jgi:DNA-binding GntR family transcriptional regulator
MRPDDEKPLPAYLDLAGRLRADIIAGRFPPGAKLPSETQLMMRQQVSRSVAKWAIAVLKADGLVDGRQGAGVFVRATRRIVRQLDLDLLVPRRPLEDRLLPQSGAQLEPGLLWSARVPADELVAARLAVSPGDLVTHAIGRYFDGDVPIQLVRSWQRTGPVDVDEVCERIIVRPASPDEIVALALPARGSVLAVSCTHSVQGVPVAVADLILVGDRHELVYRVPLRG